MKKTLRLGAIILSLVVAFTMCAASVFATSAADTAPEGEGEVIELTEEEAAMLFGAMGGASSLADIGTTVYSIPTFGLEMALPNYASTVTADSPSADIQNALGVGLDSLLGSGYIAYAVSDDSSDVVYATFDVTEYTKIVGSYNSLSDEELQAIMDANVANYQLEPGNIELLEQGGVKFIHMTLVTEETDEQSGATSIVESQLITTIHNGIQYDIVLQFSDINEETDRATINAIKDSIKVSNAKLGYALSGNAGLSTYDIIMLVVNILLLIAVVVLSVITFKNAKSGKGEDALASDEDEESEALEDIIEEIEEAAAEDIEQ